MPSDKEAIEFAHLRWLVFLMLRKLMHRSWSDHIMARVSAELPPHVQTWVYDNQIDAQLALRENDSEVLRTHLGMPPDRAEQAASMQRCQGVAEELAKWRKAEAIILVHVYGDDLVKDCFVRLAQPRFDNVTKVFNVGSTSIFPACRMMFPLISGE